MSTTVSGRNGSDPLTIETVMELIQGQRPQYLMSRELAACWIASELLLNKKEGIYLTGLLRRAEDLFGNAIAIRTWSLSEGLIPWFLAEGMVTAHRKQSNSNRHGIWYIPESDKLPLLKKMAKFWEKHRLRPEPVTPTSIHDFGLGK